MAVKPFPIAFLALGLAWPAMADDCLEAARAAPMVVLAGVDAMGDPVLSDGRRLRLVGLAPRQDEHEAKLFAAALEGRAGAELRLLELGEPDRWGRLPARLLLPGDPPAASLAAELIAARAAQAMPEAAFPECGAKVPAPVVARRSTSVAPALPSPPPSEGSLDGHDVAALKARTGRLVAVEGRVASVGERAQRTYLNFSRRRGEAGAVMLPSRLWRELQAAGWTAEGLSGRRIRARGVLSGQDGTLLEVNAASALELID